MLRNYITVALRNLYREKGFAAVNILGLALGIACCLLVSLYVQKELSYDNFHTLGDRTYRIIRESRTTNDGSSGFDTGILGPLPRAIADAFPEVASAFRVYTHRGWVSSESLDKKFRRKFVVTEPGYLKVFDFPLILGSIEDFLHTPNTVLISAETARLFFGTEDPLGKTITSDYKYIDGDYVVVGVIDMPENTNFGYDILTLTVRENSSLQKVWDTWRPGVEWRPVLGFLTLQERGTATALEQKLPDMIAAQYGQDFADRYVYHLQPIERVHLYSDTEYGFRIGGDIRYVYGVGVGGVFILFLACVNYINLSTARAVRRSREVGLRKVVGAQRIQIVGQFLGEAFFSVLLATLLGWMLANAFLPVVSGVTGQNLTFSQWHITDIIITLFLVIFLVSILAGLYPAVFLSRFQALGALRGGVGMRNQMTLRKILVVFQFAISAVFLAGTQIIGAQLDFMRTKDLGFRKEYVIEARFLGASHLLANWRQVKERLLQHPAILGVSASNKLPGMSPDYRYVRPEGSVGSSVRVVSLAVDEDFIDLYGIELLQGMNTLGPIQKREDRTLLINESAMRAFGEGNLIGKRILNPDGTFSGTVGGVVKDFHTRSLHHQMEPTMLWFHLDFFRSLSFKIKADQVQEAVAFLEASWNQMKPGQPFSFRFLDETLQRAYVREKRAADVTRLLSFLAIIVACLGLLGLSSYAAHQRTREMSIRKIVGASDIHIVKILTIDFLRWVVVASVISIPIINICAQQWLQGFAYRVALGPMTYLGGGFIAVFVALLTVIWEALRVARTNPVDSLRQE